MDEFCEKKNLIKLCKLAPKFQCKGRGRDCGVGLGGCWWRWRGLGVVLMGGLGGCVGGASGGVCGGSGVGGCGVSVGGVCVGGVSAGGVGVGGCGVGCSRE